MNNRAKLAQKLFEVANPGAAWPAVSGSTEAYYLEQADAALEYFQGSVEEVEPLYIMAYVACKDLPGVVLLARTTDGTYREFARFDMRKDALNTYRALMGRDPR